MTLLSQMANQLDSVFSAMADPTRRAVIERLLKGPASVSDLHAPHAMAMPSFLKHIRKLEEAGLVTSQKTGRTRMIHIEPAPMAAAENWLRQQRKFWEGRLDRLQLLVKALERKPQ
jgi:DNA-binding transcriptional ArsR family regulator